MKIQPIPSTLPHATAEDRMEAASLDFTMATNALAEIATQRERTAQALLDILRIMDRFRMVKSRFRSTLTRAIAMAERVVPARAPEPETE